MKCIALSCLLIVSATGSSQSSRAQETSSPDPYKGFVGQWTGTAVVNPTHEPSPIRLTISELPDGSMVWNYTFGTKGLKHYSQPSKTIGLDPQSEKMTSQWKGEPLQTFATVHLKDFTQSGSGTFEACEDYTTHSLFSSKHGTSCITYELQSNHLSYTWKVTKDGKTSVYSEFVFDRVRTAPAPSATP